MSEDGEEDGQEEEEGKEGGQGQTILECSPEVGHCGGRSGMEEGRKNCLLTPPRLPCPPHPPAPPFPASPSSSL
eukprot:1956462-Pyramimonas_sp.AAC.1